MFVIIVELQEPGDLESIDFGQHQVENYQIRSHGSGFIQTVKTVERSVYLIFFGFQSYRQRFYKVLFVVNY